MKQQNISPYKLFVTRVYEQFNMLKPLKQVWVCRSYYFCRCRQLIDSNPAIKGIRLYLWNRRSNSFPGTVEGKRLLHVGCGEINSSIYVNLDARSYDHVHIRTKNLFRLSMIPDESFHLVYMSHVLEHVPRVKVAGVLVELKRILKSNGILRLSVPDFDHLVAAYIDSGRDMAAINGPLMGGQDYPFNFHYSVFNKGLLQTLLEQAGFYDVREWVPGNSEYYCFSDWASRKHAYKGRQYFISLNLEATKQ